MIDMHHDLLSIIYYSYLRNDDKYLREWIKNFNGDNVSGLLANLYFMSEEEMKQEIGDNEIDVLEMFRIATELFKKYLPDTKVIYSIEGCDYIKDTNELEELYKLGLRNILLVWNNPNKYASGNRGNYGLTELGKEFLLKAIDLGICIDLSHMNEKTYADTIELIKDQQTRGKNVKVIASHSNLFKLCPHVRNFSDEQVRSLKDVDGILGIVGYGDFVSSNATNLKDEYLKHLKRAVSIMGIDNVGVSTDDMLFASRIFGEEEEKMVFNYSTVKDELTKLLRTSFSDSEIEKILYRNINDKLFEEEKI